MTSLVKCYKVDGPEKCYKAASQLTVKYVLIVGMTDNIYTGINEIQFKNSEGNFTCSNVFT